MADHPELPDELRGQGKVRPQMSAGERAERLMLLGQVIARKRDEAVKARKDSGIEEVWLACEEAYLGIDDVNRAEFEKAKWAKPTTMAGPVTTNTVRHADNKSTAYVRLTTRYVDMGAAKISEICLPIDDKAFSFDPTPVPELVAALEAEQPQPVMGQAAPNPGTAQPAQLSPAAQAAKATIDKARTAAEKAEKRVYDWMVESRYPKQMRKVIHDAARIGVGVLKGPFPEERTRKAFSVKDGVGELQILKKTSPACKWIDPWNLFPAGNCGEDIHSGDGIFERDYLSPGSLKSLKNLRLPPVKDEVVGPSIYIPSQIDKVLAEGPDKCNVDDDGRRTTQATNKNRFTIWYYTGTLDREDMQALDVAGVDDLPDDVVECKVIVTLVNDSVIRATINPLEKTGRFGYRVFPWSRRAGHWTGVGVAEQVSMPQRTVNAGVRSWFNNAGKAAGSQIVMDQRAVVPADNNWEIVPDKLWFLQGDAVVEDIRKVFMAVQIPDVGVSLFRIVEFAFKTAEELSNIPLISQGQAGPNDPQTFGQAELQNSNANTLLRQLAYNLDDCITEPLVDDFYEWLLLDPEIPLDEKGDFDINARGSIAMVEKAIQEQTLMMLGAMVTNPVYGIDPKKWAGESLRAKRLDPAKLQYTDEELQQMQSQPPPETPQEKVAKINATTRLHVADMDGQVKREIAANSHDRGVAYEQALADQDRVRLELGYRELELRERLAMLDYAKKRHITLDQVKAELAQTSMKLEAQREISRDNLAVTIHQHHNPPPAPDALTPPTEPAGRAAPGQSFAQ